ncbi:MAG: phosphatase PAP2 family protein [Acidobacteriota bacterium]|nr:phosphatase PAP2 family protein [Acidobacteriota bacterium]
MTRIASARLPRSRHLALAAAILLAPSSAWLAAAQSSSSDPVLAGASSAQSAPAQSSSTDPILPDAPQAQTAPKDSSRNQVTIIGSPRAILRDQLAIWTSPAHIHDRDLAYLVPLGLTTAVLMTTDHQVMSSSRLQNTSLNNHAVDASNGLVGGFVAAPVIIWGLGHIHQDDHATETGILGGEAMVDSIIVEQVLKIASMRERPTVDNARGKFFQTSAGIDSSFPSSHSMVAWSSAAVIASEYKGPLTQLTAYGLATGVSLTRVLGRQHFPSDALVGSAVGWMIGRYVYHKHTQANE